MSTYSDSWRHIKLSKDKTDDFFDTFERDKGINKNVWLMNGSTTKFVFFVTSCWTSRSKPMQLRRNGSGGTFNRAASTLMPKNFFLTKSEDLLDDVEEDLFGSPGRPGPTYMARQMSMPANIGRRYHSPTSISSNNNKRDFNTLYWNGRSSPFEDVGDGVSPQSCQFLLILEENGGRVNQSHDELLSWHTGFRIFR